MDPEKRAISKRRYEDAHRDERRAATADWKAANRDQVRAGARAYAAAHQEEQAAYQRDHAGERAAARARRHAANRDADNHESAVWRRDNPERARRSRTSKHRMMPGEIDRLYERQGGRCAICGTARPLNGRDGLFIDHDHQTGARRGLICNGCNVALPLIERFGEGWAAAALAYLADPPLVQMRRVA